MGENTKFFEGCNGKPLSVALPTFYAGASDKNPVWNDQFIFSIFMCYTAFER
jgi:hypothetical protein